MENSNLQSMELDDMRSQLGLLKDKINEEKIINDRLLRESMRSKMGWIRTFFWLELLVALPFIAFALVLAKMSSLPISHFSWWTFAALMLILAVDIYFDYRVNVAPLKEHDYDRDNLVATVGKLIKMKRQRKLQAIIGIATMVPAIGWGFAECWMAVGDDPAARADLHAMTVSCIIGAIIGGIGGVIMIGRMQRTNDRMISQINEITPER